jgi:hypothetical protein
MCSVIRQFGAILVFMLIVACGQLPLPFQPSAPNLLVTEVAARGIWIQPLDGVSRPMSKLLAGAVAEGFQSRGFHATTNPKANSRYWLKGKAVINEDDSSKPYVVLINWNLFNYSGKSLGKEVIGVSGSLRDWHFGSPIILAEISKTTPDIISSIIDADKMIAKLNNSEIKPNLWGVWVNPVTNAPGDGNSLLTLAIKEVIQKDGIRLATTPRLAQFFLDGNVHVGLPKNSLQRVEIVWRVSTPDSQEVGQAMQKNVVKAGTFSNAWGKVAVIVAEAALEGIKGILQHANLSRLNLETSKRALKMNVPSALESIVLPPPKLDLE